MVDGNYTFSYPDLRLEGAIPLTFLRVYSSRDEDGSLGKGFTHGYDYHLLNDDGIIRVTMPYGEEIIFLYTGRGYRPLQNQGFTLGFDGTGYIMTHEYGAKFYFENDGKLKDVKNPDGVLVASMEYEGEHLSKISGIAGEYNLFWDDGKHITKIVDNGGREVEYIYESHSDNYNLAIGQTVIVLSLPDMMEQGYILGCPMRKSNISEGEVKRTFSDGGFYSYKDGVLTLSSISKVVITAPVELKKTLKVDGDCTFNSNTNTKGTTKLNSVNLQRDRKSVV